MSASLKSSTKGVLKFIGSDHPEYPVFARKCKMREGHPHAKKIDGCIGWVMMGDQKTAYQWNAGARVWKFIGTARSILGPRLTLELGQPLNLFPMSGGWEET